MQNDPVLSRLGFARKAGKLKTGFAAAKESVLDGTARLIVIASDVSPKSEKEMRFFSREKVTVVKTEHTMDNLSRAIGIKAGIVSVCDDGFAGAILANMK